MSDTDRIALAWYRGFLWVVLLNGVTHLQVHNTYV